MAGMRRFKEVNVVISGTMFNAHIEKEEATASSLKDVHAGLDTNHRIVERGMITI